MYERLQPLSSTVGLRDRNSRVAQGREPRTGDQVVSELRSADV